MISGVLRTARDGGYDACQDSYRYGSRSRAVSNEMPRLTRYDTFLATIIDYRRRRVVGLSSVLHSGLCGARLPARLMGHAGLTSKRPPPARATSAAYTGIHSRLKYAASRRARQAQALRARTRRKKFAKNCPIISQTVLVLQTL